MEKLLQQYDIDTSQAIGMDKDKFKDYVDKQAIKYLRNHWTEPPRKYGGAIHTRYIASFEVGKLTTTRPKLRRYIKEVFKTSSPAENGKGVELCMHMRLGCLGLNAFHSHRRQGESLQAQRNRELCPGCRQAAETPTHFLLECPAYSAPRSVLLTDAIADAQTATPGANGADMDAWRVIMARMQPGVIKFVQDAWGIRRAALTGHGADGGNPMALPPVP
jgi:hypothetical protein